jgi:hypothetical protein
MKSCLDLDTLTSVGQALDWDVVQLDHVHGCDECRAQLEVLKTTRALLTEEESVRPGFADGVMAAIAHRTHHEQRAKAWIAWLNPALAGMTAVVVAWAARPAPWALATSAVVASLVVMWRERAAGTSPAGPP